MIADRMVEAAQILRDAEKPVRILRTIAWEPEVRERFFAAGEVELPEPSYEALDPSASFEKVNAARQLLDGDDDPISDLLRRTAWAIELGARMLAAVGTPDFHRYSTLLYGEPSSQLPDQASSALDLARTFESTLDAALHVALAPVETRTADEVAEQVGRAVVRHFGDAAPSVEVVEHLSANALAGTHRIRLRRGAAFTDRDAAQLIQHEAYVHIATSIAGRGQPLSILACGHPGTTRTQEGLAVFAELISGAIDPDRLRRLADRVLAIQMAQDGADFLDVYRWYVEQTGGDREQAFENARRVFRGGVLRGRAPFTKDVVYLDGLLRVHNFLRSAVMSGRADCIRLLFAGKLDIEDVPALCHLAARGALAPAPYLPPWVADLRFLVAYLAYSGFLNQVDLDVIRTHYQTMLADAPRVDPA